MTCYTIKYSLVLKCIAIKKNALRLVRSQTSIWMWLYNNNKKGLTVRAILFSSDCLSSCLSCKIESRSASVCRSLSISSWPASAARNMFDSASWARASMALKASSVMTDMTLWLANENSGKFESKPAHKISRMSKKKTRIKLEIGGFSQCCQMFLWSLTFNTWMCVMYFNLKWLW